MIEMDNVTKTYQMGKNIYQALKGISFKIETGELVSIIGPSGSGKTTTMNIIGLMDHPTSGRFLLENKEISQFSKNELAQLRNQKIGFIFQAFFLLPRLSALQNVGLPLFYSGEKPAAIKTRALEMLDKVGMAKFAAHKPYELSGGQRQRVAIARALVSNPKVILADEPTGALDTKTAKVILDLMIHQTKDSTVIVITHDPEVAAHCPRIIEIRDGLIIRDERRE